MLFIYFEDDYMVDTAWRWQ